MTIQNQYRLLLRVSAAVGVIVSAKLVAHHLGWEVLSINPLFSGIIAGNVFLMGFLLSGVLSDYKESERLPGELSACLENMAEEVAAVGLSAPEAKASVEACRSHVSRLSRTILDWFKKRQGTGELIQGVNELTVRFAAMETWTQPAFIARLKQEQSNLRRTLVRIHTIRETSFVSAGYLLADITTVLLCIGLVLVKMEHFYESLFLSGVISYLMIFLLILIRDLDNPFGYYERYSGADVSLKPLEDTARRLAEPVTEAAPRLGATATMASPNEYTVAG